MMVQRASYVHMHCYFSVMVTFVLMASLNEFKCILLSQDALCERSVPQLNHHVITAFLHSFASVFLIAFFN